MTIGETGRNLTTRLTEHKRATRKANVNNHIAEHYQLTNHTIDWDSAQCVTHSTNYFQRLILESWFTNLEQRRKFSSRMWSTGNIELIITSLVNTKLYICINLASMATPRAKIWFSQWNLTAYVMYVSEIGMADVCIWKRPLLSKIWVKSVILPVFDENTLLWWSPTSTPYEIDPENHKRRLQTLLNNW